MRLYLDIDGVLHAYCSFTADPEYEQRLRVCSDGGKVYWHPTFFEHLPAFAAALEPFPTVEVYLHSSWRHMWEESRPIDLVEWFGPLGARFVRSVPKTLTGPRYWVIQDDMRSDGYEGPWIAIDDESVSFAECPPIHFVETHPKRGLGDPTKIAELVEKITRQLANPAMHQASYIP